MLAPPYISALQNVFTSMSKKSYTVDNMIETSNNYSWTARIVNYKIQCPFRTKSMEIRGGGIQDCKCNGNFKQSQDWKCNGNFKQS